MGTIYTGHRNEKSPRVAWALSIGSWANLAGRDHRAVCPTTSLHETQPLHPLLHSMGVHRSHTPCPQAKFRRRDPTMA